MSSTWADGNSVIVVHNFAAHPAEARFRVQADGGDHLTNLLVNEDIYADASGMHRVTLEAYGYRWYRVGGMGYALRGARDSGAGVNW
jgi:maltose alpha-D-glucosyltransferase/alpha-amylase